MKTFTDDEGNEALEIESDGGFNAFKLGISDKKQWNRHEETIQLNNYLNTKLVDKNFVVVKYQDTFTKVKK